MDRLFLDATSLLRKLNEENGSENGSEGVIVLMIPATSIARATDSTLP